MIRRALLLVPFALAGCEDRPSPSATPSSSAPPASAAPLSSAAKSASSISGDWRGGYQAKRFRIEMSKKEGAVRQWDEDDETSHTGKGEIELHVDGKGTVRGSSSGPLGDLVASGELDKEALRVGLSPVDPAKEPSFKGYLIGKLEKGELTGRIQAASGDGLIVREADVKLVRVETGAAPPAGAQSPAP